MHCGGESSFVTFDFSLIQFSSTLLSFLSTSVTPLNSEATKQMMQVRVEHKKQQNKTPTGREDNQQKSESNWCIGFNNN